MSENRKVRVRLDPVAGLIEESVSEGKAAGLVIGPGNVSGLSPFATNVKAVTEATTLGGGDGGVITVSGTGAAITVSLPAASTVPGVIYMLRSLSDHAHVITASGEAALVQAFSTMNVVDVLTGSRGSRVTLEGRVGDSCALMCDGVNYLVMATSGSTTLADG